jgi:hypothetical protein
LRPLKAFVQAFDPRAGGIAVTRHHDDWLNDDWLDDDWLDDDWLELKLAYIIPETRACARCGLAGLFATPPR